MIQLCMQQAFDTCVCLQLQTNGNLIYTEDFVSCTCCKHVSLWGIAVLCYHLVGDEQYAVIGSDFCGIQKNQGKGRVISWRLRLRLITFTEILIILDITKTESNSFFIIHWQKEKWKSCFCCFTEGKQHKAYEFDMITFSNHAPWSYMTWLPVTLCVLDMIIV